MKVFIIGNKKGSSDILKLQAKLKEIGFSIILSNGNDKLSLKSKCKTVAKLLKKDEMIKYNERIISAVDCVLVLNSRKNDIDNYIDGDTFLKMYDAFKLEKPIYLMHDISEGMFKNEIMDFNPIILNGNINRICKQGIIYNKLIRDKIPEIISANGERPIVETLNKKDYKNQLDIKLQEELREYFADDNVEELADVVEVIYAILDYKGISLDEFESIRNNKRKERGAFKKRLLLRKVIK